MSDSQFEILGQKIAYPNTWPACFSVLIFCTALVIIVYIISTTSKETIHAIGGVVSGVTTAEGLTEHEDVYKIGFWTPSNETAAFWKEWESKSATNNIEEKNRWEANAGNNDKAVEFGKILACDGCPALGYRRYKTSGKGRGLEKPGYWWIATIHNDFSDKYFVKMYSNFWGSKDTIYVEITRSIKGKYAEQ